MKYLTKSQIQKRINTIVSLNIRRDELETHGHDKDAQKVEIQSNKKYNELVILFADNNFNCNDFDFGDCVIDRQCFEETVKYHKTIN